jgi:hypothetical protein
MGVCAGLPAGRRSSGRAAGRTLRRVSVEPSSAAESSRAAVDLFWIPLGAGGVGFVRMNGRIYEAVKARSEQRAPLPLYHTALEVHVPEGRFTIENAWPSPNRDKVSRGVVVEGPVYSRRIARLRVFRYEVRRWADGVIPDARDAVGGPQRLSTDQGTARRLLDVVPSVPVMVWGRDELGTGEMWNSNSVISWLLARADLAPHRLRPPASGRAPGWQAGIVAARSDVG